MDRTVRRMVCGWWLVWALMMSGPAQAQQFDWQEIALPEGVELFSVAASPDRLIAVGAIEDSSFSFGVVYTSVNGSDWQPLDIGTGNLLLGGVAFIRDQWLIHRIDGDIQRSTDGLNWSVIDVPDDIRLRGGSFFEINGEIVVIGPAPFATSPTRVIVSEDLVNWELRFQGGGGLFGSPKLFDIVSSGQQLVGLSIDPPPSVIFKPRPWTSTDGGENWIAGNFLVEDVVWDGRQFLAIWLWEPPLNPLGTLVPGGDWQFPEFTEQAINPYYQLAVNRGFLLLAGGGFASSGTLFERSILISIDGGNRWIEQDISALNSGRFFDEFSAWRDGWISVGESIILGTPRPPQAVPAGSGWALLLLIGLVLMLSTRVFRSA